jgi:hypothetical protein
MFAPHFSPNNRVSIVCLSFNTQKFILAEYIISYTDMCFRNVPGNRKIELSHNPIVKGMVVAATEYILLLEMKQG